MRNLWLMASILIAVLFSMSSIHAQSGRVVKGVTISSPSGLKTPPPNLPRGERVSRLPNDPIKARDIPDYVVFGTVFRLAQMGWSAEKERGFSPSDIFICSCYRKKKVLNGKQEKALLQIAQETSQELNKLNAQAKPLMEEFRAKMRSGMIVRGEGRPEPPPELEEISKKKIALIEEAILKLKTDLGDKKFAEFLEFVDENIRSSITGSSLNNLPR